MIDPTLPRPTAPLVDGQARPTREWYDFLRQAFESFEGDAAMQAQIAEAMARIDALELSENATLKGTESVRIAGTLASGLVQFRLAGDEQSPPATSYYGTESGGEKGWHAVADALDVAADELTKVVDSDTGIITFGLADVTPAAGGTLQLTGFDGKGRLSERGDATTDDLPEGGDNLYFTDERAAAAAPVQSVNDKTGAVTLSASDVGAQPAAANLTSWAAIAPSEKQDAGFITGTSATVRLHNSTGSSSAGAIWITATPTLSYRIDGVQVFAVTSGGNFVPDPDNTRNLGSSSARWANAWVASGVINPSDAREKTPVRPLTEAEIAAAIELGGEIGIYQWLAMIAEKGEEGARLHVGMTVQRAIEIMESHGLDPFRYGFICYDEWGELPELWEDIPAQIDGEGNEVSPATLFLVQGHRPAGNRYSFRPDELLAFIARGLAYRLDAIEQRLATAGL